MPLTDKLGTSDSRLANIQLAIGASYGGLDYDESASSTLTLTHVATASKDVERSVNQSVVLVHSVSVNIRKVVAVSQTLTLVSGCVGIQSVKASNVLVLSQSATYTTAKICKHTLVLTQSVAREVDYNRTLNSNFIPFQAVSVSKTYRRTVTHTLTLTQTIVDHLVHAVSHSLVLSQEAEVDKVTPASNVLNLTQTAGFNYTLNLDASSFLSIEQATVIHKSVALRAKNVASFVQYALANRNLTRTIESELNLAQDLVRDRTDESNPQSLTLAQTATCSKLSNKTATSELVLSQAASCGKRIDRSVSQTLVFKHSHDRPTGIPTQPYVTIDDAYVVKAYPFTILQVPGTTIMLPKAEFNDSESNPARINIKRSMNGYRRVYKRTTLSHRLHYDFVIDRRKARELRTFLLNHNSEPITLTNWKGEVWTVLLTNTPFILTEEAYWGVQPGGNKCSIPLEFEGVRVN